ncbi:MbtH family protein [Streptomyces sp. NPDC014746]|uniref:MbtH family protein n=1 Tax=Streptomyces sp. NPDC014746 TaxID=3364904 RepID=UPI0036F5049E
MSDDQEFTVVVNHEEQYSIWWSQRPLPSGWGDAGFHGSREDCLSHIADVWTDMRPLSLRKRMDGAPA